MPRERGEGRGVSIGIGISLARAFCLACVLGVDLGVALFISTLKAYRLLRASERILSVAAEHQDLLSRVERKNSPTKRASRSGSVVRPTGFMRTAGLLCD